MKTKLIYIALFLVSLQVTAQNQFHVFPSDHKTKPGKNTGNGTIEQPWDLSTALNQKPSVVNGGDTVWIHEGIYNGRFVSTLQSTIAGKDILVSAYKNDKVVLNGNVESKNAMVLEIRGGHVIYQNFEVTWLGNFSRNEADPNFRKGGGIRHLSGENVKFYNLKIHDNPGLGFGFWKHGGASVIEDCMIYNNGFVAKNGKGRGEGIYVQNKSDQMKFIKNTIIFNNYYKGVEVWSAGKNANFEYVKNITLQGNFIFNSGNPVGRHYDNIIVASADRNGINIAKNIRLLDNVLYHNLDVKGRLLGDGPSLTLGFNKNAPITDVLVQNNVIIGRSDGLRILHADKITFKNNTVHTGFVHMSNENPKYIDQWVFDGNSYFLKSPTPFRMIKHSNNSVDDWRNTYGLDRNSSFKSSKELKLPKVLKLNQSELDTSKFHLALFDLDGNDVEVDFTKFDLEIGADFKVVDVENDSEVLFEGSLSKNGKILFPMSVQKFRMPSNNSKSIKTPRNFGVFIIKFEEKTRKKNSKGLVKRIIKDMRH